MAQTGEYSFSRLPGHPVQEYLLMLIPNAGPFIFNLITAIFSVIATLVFGAILRHLKINSWFIWSLVFASIPIVYISSIYTIDYIWALCFILVSYFFLLKDKLIYAGLFLGLAIGCRITSGAVLPGFLWMLNYKISKKSLTKGLVLSGLTISVAAACYLPSFLRYGIAFFDTYRLPYPSLPKVIYKGTFGVWGLTGFVALIVLKLQQINKSGQKSISQISLNQYRGALLTIVLYACAFIVLPQKSAFWLPAIPFILIALLRYELNARITVIIATLFLISPFFGGVNLNNSDRGADPSFLSISDEVAGQNVFFDVINGPLQIEQSRRKNRQKYVQNCLPAYYNLKGKNLVICGWWTNQFIVNAQGKGLNNEAIIGEFYDEKQLDSLVNKGFTLWYLNEIDQANDERYGMKKTAKVAKQLLPVK